MTIGDGKHCLGYGTICHRIEQGKAQGYLFEEILDVLILILIIIVDKVNMLGVHLSFLQHCLNMMNEVVMKAKIQSSVLHVVPHKF